VITIMVPMAGKSQFYDAAEYYYPKPLIDMYGEPMIQRVLAPFLAAKIAKKFAFVINESDAKAFHIDRTLRLIVGEDSVVVEQVVDTAGALPGCLLAIDHIDRNKPLIVSNSDQILDIDLDAVIAFFKKNKADAGPVTFKSVHPQWSYVALDERGQISEAAEKKPISRNAIAGFYYFASGGDFIDTAMRVIEKGASLNDKFYISSTFNELILDGKKLVAYTISNERYHSLYSPEMLQRYSDRLAAAK
jgi:NDP-sugar pyrophosphorylase family protein